MPLAFTQEDFLFEFSFTLNNSNASFYFRSFLCFLQYKLKLTFYRKQNLHSEKNLTKSIQRYYFCFTEEILHIILRGHRLLTIDY